MSAGYDYDKQRWETGTRGELLRKEQIREMLDTLKGPKGDEFARFMGIADKVGMIARLEADLRGEL